MFQGFLKVLSVPRSKRLISFGFMARSPMGMKALAVMGAMTAAQLLVGPGLGRSLEIYVPTRVLLVTAGGHGVFGPALAIAIITARQISQRTVIPAL
jgi:hypothetical protein